MTTPQQTDRITPAELRAVFQSLNERLDLIDNELAAMREGFISASSIPPEGSPGQTIEFLATLLLVGVDDNGQPTYKAKGGQYMMFGVRVWPEILPELGIDPAKLKPGPNPINLPVLALMGDKGPRKIIGLSNKQNQPQQPKPAPKASKPTPPPEQKTVQPAPAATTQGTAPTRPYPQDVLWTKLIEKSAANNFKPASENDCNLLMSALRQTFAGSNVANKLAEDLLYSVAKVRDVNILKSGMVHALLAWLDPKQDSGGSLVIADLVIEEAHSLLEKKL